eukprot:TRINITY_DN1909_c0_g1_i1.p1 TRINITY_DN1909_c0_g1~~TRINITY_DN1909_c0_g1_i1.p1  ORF type:complete len:942 (-),score=280.99 TRINITY_DN1909_c0_g1_i1:21-2822(-)
MAEVQKLKEEAGQIDQTLLNDASGNQTNQYQNKKRQLKHRGAQYSFDSLNKTFKANIFSSIPILWQTMTNYLFSFSNLFTIHTNNNNSGIPSPFTISEQDSISISKDLQVITAVVTKLDGQLHDLIIEQIMPKIIDTIKITGHHSILRTATAKALSVICKTILHPAMRMVITLLLPILGDVENTFARLGATVVLQSIITELGIDILPYIVFLIVPILGRMSDQNNEVRKVITHCFATLIRIMPLESGIPDPPGLPQALMDQKQRERKFLEQLLDGSKLENYSLPIKINAELRKYQQEGVNWLGFLNKYQLHGILCDDMGLGKTLQSICIMASDDWYRKEKFNQVLKETGKHSPEFGQYPCLVVCPPTVAAHWFHEIKKFCDSQNFVPLLYTGKPALRKEYRDNIRRYNAVIMSYDILRNDIEELETITFNYCVLDEGHIIKNGKTRITQAVKRIKANHRVILSGTPIQNNVLELWSLFDFLMPGFLGSEKQFNELYSKPILASKDPKCSEKDQEAGTLALEALHRQVLPFLLRRIKEDVLSDLPPKIIQDYYCELSPLQTRLYEDFAKTHAKEGIDKAIENGDEEEESKSKGGGEKKGEGATHIFQALQYLRKLCSHPVFVLNSQHSQYYSIMKEFLASKTNNNNNNNNNNSNNSVMEFNNYLHQIEHAPKLIALQQLLIDCGLGGPENASSSSSGALSQADEEKALLEQGAGSLGGHRVLLFTQMKSMLDIIESDLFRNKMKHISFLRLDGTVPSNKRHEIVTKFNDDPTIDVLLLTTHVGGLGLNLTGADTVIFVEHDWNPMKDLQAMDRAHRIGQKRVVNVYRLITRGTLEEKIMGLQKFKLNIANSVVNEDNSSIRTMDTNQLLDLFNYSGEGGAGGVGKGEEEEGDKEGGAGGKATGLSSVVQGLEELWDESQYQEEYDLGHFLGKLN